MHVHIGRKKDATKIKADEDFVLIAESGSTCSFFYQDWAKLGSDILKTTAAISDTEKQVFEELREQVNQYSSQLRRNARIIDELDVTIGFANLAHEMSFVRPTIKEK